MMPDSVVHQQSYWLTGMIVGAAIGLVGGLELQHELCNNRGPGKCSDADHVWFLVPTTVFGVVGGLIGSTIHRQ